MVRLSSAATAAASLATAHAACISTGTQDTINALFRAGGANTIVSLCPGATIPLTDSVVFTAPGQELSTQGYPTDSTRAAIVLQPGSAVSTAILGKNIDFVRVLNIVVDGNRPNAGQFGGDALLEMGGGSTGQVVQHIVAKDTRSWSCLHLIGNGQGANPCRNATIAFNTVGPCGTEGRNDDGSQRWADGLSIECESTTVTDNTISGSTDGGIVIFGAPNSHFLRNSITSSATYQGFGAINMVDFTYGGNYSGVVVSDNVITGIGSGFFNLGIGMGSQIWSNPHPEENFGPTVVTNNVFKGNVGYSISLNGWTGGLTVTGNDVSQVHAPSSDFADASLCGKQQQDSFDANQQLVYFPAGVQGPLTIQPEFIATPLNGSNWQCLSHPLPTSTTISAAQGLFVHGNAAAADLHHFRVWFQGDGNLGGHDTTGGGDQLRWATQRFSTKCGDGSACLLAWQGDGNFVAYDADGPFWDSGTQGKGVAITFASVAPWVAIKDASGATIWTIADLEGSIFP